jgi:hypothetical protein
MCRPEPPDAGGCARYVQISRLPVLAQGLADQQVPSSLVRAAMIDNAPSPAELENNYSVKIRKIA